MKTVSNADRDLLFYRPKLVYSEPEQLPGEISPTQETPQVEDVQALNHKVKNMAQSVNTLAIAVQAAIDTKAASLVIKLYPQTDGAVIASMKRLFGADVDATQITYAQYRSCYDRLMKHGNELSKQMIIDPADVNSLRNKMQSPLENVSNTFLNTTDLGGYGNPDAGSGSLRPELQATHVIEPLDLEKFQSDTIASFVNMIWKDYIKPVVAVFPGGDTLPDEIAPVPEEDA